ncbi:MAG: DNA polymerase III subunit gamma/tau [Candidatus Manganitrophaceae bacterium]
MTIPYQVSARKWRPQTFDEVIGQHHVATTLMNAVRQGRVAHAYLFSGIRGVGKTTMARLLAKALNCETLQEAGPCNRCDSCREITEGHSVDVAEIDGASNTGVDDVRELREKVKYLPLRGKYKIYIIDEVHMLSNAAFNALLKTLEEPPPHLAFIFATTESHKIPATILSRCQHFVFRRIPRREVVEQLRRVAEERRVRFAEGGLALISRAAEGSMRDALSLLDQAIAYGGKEIGEEDLFALLGRMGEARFHSLARAIHERDAKGVLSLAKEISDHGYDLRQFLSDWLEYLRNLIVIRHLGEPEGWIDLPKEEVEELQKEAVFFSDEDLQRIFVLFSRLQEEIRTASHPHLLLEVALMRTITFTRLRPVEELLERLDALIGRGGGAGTSAIPPTQQRIGQGTSSVPTVSSLPSEKKGGWEKVLVEIKEKRPMLGAYLGQGTLLEVTDQRVRIGYSEPFLISMIQSEENMKMINVLLKTHLRKETALELVDLEREKGKSPPSTTHPFIQEALRVLGGEIIETKPGQG